MVQAHRWGIVSTIKAPVDQILNFAAWHIEQGADHLFIYLDNDNPDAENALKHHPRITVTRTDDAYWKDLMGRIPGKHQRRQCINAQHAYELATDLDWLAHIDVDEFLMPSQPVATLLAALPAKTLIARARPEEILSQEGQPDSSNILAKAWLPPQKRGITEHVYPTYGRYFRGGFISHFWGKIFVRTGRPGFRFRIHDVFQRGKRVPSQELPEISLLHDHSSDWESWLASYRYRHAKGSYRAELEGEAKGKPDSLTPHQLLHRIEAEGGEAGLRRFFEEMCLATPELVTRLEQHNALKRYRLDLPAVRQKHFPQ